MTTDPRVCRSLAWGFHDPGGIVLWCLIQPTKHLHIIGELPFEQLDEQELATAIKIRDTQLGIGPNGRLEIEHIAYTVGTPEIVSNPKQKKLGFRGETVGDRLLRFGIVVIAADEDVVNGWARCQSLLRSDEAGRPWLTIDPSCTHLIQALPSGLQDAKDVDDILTPAPALTALRFLAMSRPSPMLRSAARVMPPGSPADIMRKMRRGQGRQFGEAR